MLPLLHIVGPTATGKTALALAVAQEFGGELISADSRQVYKGMDIGTGKDIPPNARWHLSDLKFSGWNIGYYQTPLTKIWGYDLTDPNRDWSIAHFHRFSGTLIRYFETKAILPIIVGGSGLYHRVLENPPETLNIPQNPQLRSQYKLVPVSELQTVLTKTFPAKIERMNQSDRSNQRRLIRALEIGYYQKKHKPRTDRLIKPDDLKSLWIGLDLPNETLERNIKARVYDRLKAGFAKEFAILKNQGLLIPGSPSSTATGYRQWLGYDSGAYSQDEAIAKWITAEMQYAHRQKTWFKTNPAIRWYAADTKNLTKLVVQNLKNWYPIVNG